MQKNFSHNLIVGKIGEIVFEQMFREAGKFTILRSGYEYLLPELAQYQDRNELKNVIAHIRKLPDFILISPDHTKVYLVEAKYRTHPNPDEMLKIAKEMLAKWDMPWLFLASPYGFNFDSCRNVVKNNGNIEKLFPTTVPQEIQNKYLKLLMEFQRPLKK